MVSSPKSNRRATRYRERIGNTSGVTVAYYDPTLSVNPVHYPNHNWGYWTELLLATRGAIVLWSRTERGGSILVDEAIEITERVFPADYWGLN
jgi:hypothetical protein